MKKKKSAIPDSQPNSELEPAISAEDLPVDVEPPGPPGKDRSNDGPISKKKKLRQAGTDLQVDAGGDLPAVAPDCTNVVQFPEAKAALEQIEQSQLGGRMKRALILVAKGASVRDAATAEDYATHSDVYRLARKFGLVDLRTKAIVETHRSVAKLSSGLLEQKLLDEPKTFSGPQLAVVSGIATDKVLASEKAATDDGSAYMSAFEQAAARIISSGAGLELRVQISPAAPKADAAIDVTPTRTE